MTKNELEAEANRVIVGAKYLLELQGNFPAMFLVHHPREGWQNSQLPAGSQHLMNSGDAKREIFGFFRTLIRERGCDGAIFASDTWQMKLTTEGEKHLDEYQQHVDSGFAKLVQMGWAMREEALTISAQNKDDALLIVQPYRRLTSGIQLLAGRREWFPQANFGGRQKMFGDLRAENLGEHPDDPAR